MNKAQMKRKIFEYDFAIHELVLFLDSHPTNRKALELIKEYRKTAVNKHDYTAECKYLEERNMLVDRGYEYGTSWLCTTFPKDELLTIIQELENETA